MSSGPFADRREAGRALGEQLAAYRDRDDVVVLGLPRGGVPVAAEVAEALGAPLDVVVVRKLGAPGQPELAMGAVAAVAGSLETVRNEDVLALLRQRSPDGDDAFEQTAASERVELQRREEAYRTGRPPLDVSGRVVVVVDDGLATGATMRAALAAVGHQDAARVVVAVPVGSRTVCEGMGQVADEVVCGWMPEPLNAVGAAYRDFTQTGDDEVRQALAAAPR